MSRKDPHLSDEKLVELLANEPSAENLRTVATHLEDCDHCQSRLEDAAAESWWWQDGKQLFASSVQAAQSNLSQQSVDHFDPQQAEVNAIVQDFSPALHPELLGQVDEFVIEKLIGVGGMGVVFKAFDQELNRPVAMKFLSPRLARFGVAQQRFIREATSVAAICHDNIIPIHRVKTQRRYPYFVMPYISGQSLEDYCLHQGAMEPEKVVQIAHQIASGLAAAHEQGLIHRDIKPANILLQNGLNRIVITDFGLVRREGDNNLTRTGMIVGTPNYMSPEQVEGKHLDGQSDLFSLGAVMYWMATGSRPFDGASQFELMNNIRQKDPVSVRSLNPRVPRGLADAIERLLEKNPNSRFASANELESYLQGYAAHLNNPMDHPEPRVSGKRSLWITISAMLVLCIFLVAGILGLWSWNLASPDSIVKKSDRAIHDAEQQSLTELNIPAIRKHRMRALANQNPKDITLRKTAEHFRVFDADNVASLTFDNRIALSDSHTDKQLRDEFVFLAMLNPEMAKQILGLWKLEVQVFGQRDLCVAEPMLFEIQWHAYREDWPTAEKRLHSLRHLLVNNAVSDEFLKQVDILTSQVSQLQNSNSAIRFCDDLIESIDKVFLKLDEALHVRYEKVYRE